jgi:hypothetical protein
MWNVAREMGGARIPQLLEGKSFEPRAGLRHQTHQTRLTAIFHGSRSVCGTLVTSISSRGLFIETDRPATEGEILSVLIGLLPDGKPPLEIDVQVVRVQPPNQAERGGLEVQFVGATAEQRARLEAYLRGLRGPHR